MNEKIKTQLRTYLDLKLRLCKQYMREQELTMARMVWQQAIGAVEFTAMSQFGINFDNNLAIEIEDIWLSDFEEAFEKTLYPEVFCLEDAAAIADMLKAFGLKPYPSGRSGTTVIIPFFDFEEVVREAQSTFPVSICPWVSTFDSYLRFCARQWYAPPSPPP